MRAIISFPTLYLVILSWYYYATLLRLLRYYITPLMLLIAVSLFFRSLIIALFPCSCLIYIYMLLIYATPLACLFVLLELYYAPVTRHGDITPRYLLTMPNSCCYMFAIFLPIYRLPYFVYYVCFATRYIAMPLSIRRCWALYAAPRRLMLRLMSFFHLLWLRLLCASLAACLRHVFRVVMLPAICSWFVDTRLWCPCFSLLILFRCLRHMFYAVLYWCCSYHDAMLMLCYTRAYYACCSHALCCFAYYRHVPAAYAHWYAACAADFAYYLLFRFAFFARWLCPYHYSLICRRCFTDTLFHYFSIRVMLMLTMLTNYCRRRYATPLLLRHADYIFHDVFCPPCLLIIDITPPLCHSSMLIFAWLFRSRHFSLSVSAIITTFFYCPLRDFSLFTTWCSYGARLMARASRRLRICFAYFITRRVETRVCCCLMLYVYLHMRFRAETPLPAECLPPAAAVYDAAMPHMLLTPCAYFFFFCLLIIILLMPSRDDRQKMIYHVDIYLYVCFTWRAFMRRRCHVVAISAAWCLRCCLRYWFFMSRRFICEQKIASAKECYYCHVILLVALFARLFYGALSYIMRFPRRAVKMAMLRALHYAAPAVYARFAILYSLMLSRHAVIRLMMRYLRAPRLYDACRAIRKTQRGECICALCVPPAPCWVYLLCCFAAVMLICLFIFWFLLRWCPRIRTSFWARLIIFAFR